MKYDEWADKQRKERGDTVEVGSKRLRKVNPKYVDNQKSHSNTSIAQNNINNEIESNAVSSKEVQVERHGENGSSPATQRLVKTSTMNNINDTTLCCAADVGNCVENYYILIQIHEEVVCCTWCIKQ